MDLEVAEDEVVDEGDRTNYEAKSEGLGDLDDETMDVDQGQEEQDGNEEDFADTATVVSDGENAQSSLPNGDKEVIQQQDKKDTAQLGQVEQQQKDTTQDAQTQQKDAAIDDSEDAEPGALEITGYTLQWQALDRSSPRLKSSLVDYCIR